jgi:hypothetical protein
MRKFAILAALSTAAVLSAGSLSAQAEVRQGFYGSAGGGFGSNYFEESAGGESLSRTKSGGTWYAAAGWMLNQKFAIGAEWNYAKTSCCGGLNNANSFYSAAFTWFPMPKNNFFAKVNLGYGGSELSESGETASEMGFSGGLGVGFDWAVGKGGFIVKPFANYMVQLSKSTYGGALDGEGIDGKASLFQIGVGIGYKH